jgi:hypothetical protein
MLGDSSAEHIMPSWANSIWFIYKLCQSAILGSTALNCEQAVECVARAAKRSVIQESHRPVRRTLRLTVVLPQ